MRATVDHSESVRGRESPENNVGTHHLPQSSNKPDIPCARQSWTPFLLNSSPIRRCVPDMAFHAFLLFALRGVRSLTISRTADHFGRPVSRGGLFTFFDNLAEGVCLFMPDNSQRPLASALFLIATADGVVHGCPPVG